MNLQKNTLFDLDLEVKVTPHIAQYPLHLLTYARVKFEDFTSKGFEGNAFTRKFSQAKLSPLPSTFCFLCSYKV